MKFLVEENELEKRHKKHKKTIKPGAMGWFIHPDGGNQVAIDSFNNSVDTGAASPSACGLGEAYVLDSEEDWALDNKLVRTNLYTKVYGGKLSHVYQSEIDGRLYALELDPSSDGYRYVGTFREYCDEITPEVTQRLVAQRMLEDLDQNGGWEDPEWRKYWGVDDDSFYDDYEEDRIDEAMSPADIFKGIEDRLSEVCQEADGHSFEFEAEFPVAQKDKFFYDLLDEYNITDYDIIEGNTFTDRDGEKWYYFYGILHPFSELYDENGAEWGYKYESLDKSLKEDKEVLYIIKDKHGNQLSRPTSDDNELWDRVDSMDPNGKKGYRVVVYTSESLGLEEDFHHATIRVKLDKDNSNYKKDIDKLDKLCRSHKVKGRLAFSDTYVITISDEDNKQTLKQRAKDIIWYIDRNIDSLVGYSNDSILAGESLTEDYDRAIKDLESIERFLRREGFDSYDVTDYDEYPMDTSVISFEIEGDWKHEHLFFENLIEEWAEENDRDIFKIDSETVGSPDSDYYTAIHTVYITRDHEATNMLNSMRGLFAESLEEDYDINEKRADFLRAIHLCKQYDPYTQYIDSYNQQKAAESRNDELSKEFDEIMHKYGIDSDGIHSYFTRADCKTDRDYIEALKQYVEFRRKNSKDI